MRALLVVGLLVAGCQDGAPGPQGLKGDSGPAGPICAPDAGQERILEAKQDFGFVPTNDSDWVLILAFYVAKSGENGPAVSSLTVGGFQSESECIVAGKVSQRGLATDRLDYSTTAEVRFSCVERTAFHK